MYQRLSRTIFLGTLPVTKASPRAKAKGQNSPFTCFKRPEAPGHQVTGVKSNRARRTILLLLTGITTKYPSTDVFRTTCYSPDPAGIQRPSHRAAQSYEEGNQKGKTIPRGPFTTPPSLQQPMPPEILGERKPF